MSNTTDHKSFWVTLPGIMTGIASLMTATVTVIAFMGNRTASDSPSPTAQSAPARSSNLCKEIPGNWNWLVGVIVLEADGRAAWKQNPLNPVPTVTGSWKCLNEREGKFSVSWNNGFTDTVTLSPDGQSYSGRNQTGVPVMATRQ